MHFNPRRAQKRLMEASDSKIKKSTNCEPESPGFSYMLVIITIIGKFSRASRTRTLRRNVSVGLAETSQPNCRLANRRIQTRHNIDAFHLHRPNTPNQNTRTNHQTCTMLARVTWLQRHRCLLFKISGPHEHAGDARHLALFHQGHTITTTLHNLYTCQTRGATIHYTIRYFMHFKP